VVTGVDDEPVLTSGLRKVKATVKNDGLLAASASRTRLEVKQTPASPFAEVANMPTPALGRGEQAVVELWQFNLFSIPAGQCLEAKACADSATDVNEGFLGGEGNNCRTRSICRN
jgi:hypothetical protein